jgi:hypothetical protein
MVWMKKSLFLFGLLCDLGDLSERKRTGVKPKTSAHAKAQRARREATLKRLDTINAGTCGDFIYPKGEIAAGTSPTGYRHPSAFFPG